MEVRVWMTFQSSLSKQVVNHWARMEMMFRVTCWEKLMVVLVTAWVTLRQNDSFWVTQKMKAT